MRSIPVPHQLVEEDDSYSKNLNVTGSVKRGLTADPNRTYLESHNLTCEYSTILKFGPNMPLVYHYCLVQFEDDNFKS